MCRYNLTRNPPPIHSTKMTDITDDAKRRAYWTEQMEAGHALVDALLPFAVAECGEGLADIRAAAEAGGVEMLFSDSKIVDDLDRIFYIRKGLVDDVVAIGRDMNARGWILKIEDGFRTRDMQTRLGRKREVFDTIVQQCVWEHGGTPPPELVFRRAHVLVANIPKVGTHMSASAIDISVFNRDDHTEVWRGGPYIEMSERTPMRSPFITAEQLENRLTITAKMEAHHFVHFPFEYWHFNQGDAMAHMLTDRPAPARYGPVDWNPHTNEVTPYADALGPLNPLSQMETEITAALDRAKAPT
jgi:D-alanyl-D-alanine dipeptidase